jgi:hypothetical protein
MGTYNSKDEIDLNEMRKRKEKEKANKMKNSNTNTNGNVNNDSNNKNIPLKYPCYNTLRNTSIKDVKQHIFTNIFPNPNNINNSTIITIDNRTNSFSYFTNSTYHKDNTFIPPTTTINHCNSFIMYDPLLNESDYIDLTTLPVLHPLSSSLLMDNTNTNTNNNINNTSSLTKDPLSDHLRKTYYSQLIIKQMWNPTIKSKHHNSIIFFDWDDTLMCTSYLTPSGLFSEDINIPEKDKEKIRNLDSLVRNILLKSIEKGIVYIITNAAPGWVEYSANRFYPNASKCLKQVNIISARGLYEKTYPGDTRLWKLKTFQEVMKDINKDLITNLLCFGDSIIEIDAVHNLAEQFSHVYIKTVKFKENPTPNELHKQLVLIMAQFDKIYANIKNVAIRVEKKKNENENS